ncbi:cytochrome P450 [Paraconexibacter algicola]|uniref:Cytochrome P450 n=1 Tax=Paraconexibacter algicola TaxID=2133960 RepID=A0A2T4UIG9_9ACTN|nr:cytochrome P450 [Paraconexibacter algicola]PTL59030.1 cytochrome P450 [Paraconexibacter algicola]
MTERLLTRLTDQPIPVGVRARRAAAAAARRAPERGVRALAQPPAGSGLQPVMGDPGPPGVGYTFNLLQDTIAFSRDRYARYGSVSWLGGFGTQVALVLGPSAIETVLANRDGAFSSQQGWNYLIGPFFERGVMLMDFEEHRHHRRIMQQAFKRDRLNVYQENMTPTIARGVERLPVGRAFPLLPAIKQLTLDIATEVFVGGELGPEADRVNEAFIETVVAGQAVVRADVPGGRWHKGLRSRRYLEQYFRGQIATKRASDGDDLFSVLCRAESEDGERFSDADIVNHMIFLMMAAHDTSTITTTMMVHYLGQHPEWQERLREESVALGKEAIGYDDLDALPAMDLAFRETLRMNGPVGIVARRTLTDTEIDGRFVPQGTLLAVGLYPSQRMEPWWSDPDRFDPERFAEGRREDLSHKYAWAPFGGNVHKCIGMHFGGMEVKAILHRLLLTRRWSVPASYDPVIDFGTGPFPADGLPVELRPV